MSNTNFNFDYNDPQYNVILNFQRDLPSEHNVTTDPVQAPSQECQACQSDLSRCVQLLRSLWLQLCGVGEVMVESRPGTWVVVRPT